MRKGVKKLNIEVVEFTEKQENNLCELFEEVSKTY